MIINWLGISNFETKLLYRGTVDTFASAAFHSKCDAKGKTIVLVQSTKGKRFGGYTNDSWKVGGEYYDCPGSFLFSLDHKTKHMLTKNN
jgi:hypothetical protein